MFKKYLQQKAESVEFETLGILKWTSGKRMIVTLIKVNILEGIRVGKNRHMKGFPF